MPVETPPTPPSATNNPPNVYDDGEIIYWPHWQYFDGATKKAILNSADGIFPKPIVEPISIHIYHIEKFVTSMTDAQLKEQYNACNSDTWKAWEPGQAWISRIRRKKAQVNGQNGLWVHYIIRCNEFGWDTNIPNMGYFYKNGSTKTSFSSEGLGPIGYLKSDGNKAVAPTEVSMSNKQIKRRINFTSTLGVS